jgi:N-acetylglutamate synthase-like GNAT family acetyltransferase
MIIRKAELKDKEKVLEVTNLLFLDIPNFVWNTDEFVSKQIKNEQYFLADIDGEVAGVISFRQREERMYIETLVINKGYQGNGVGTQLVQFAKEFAKKQGFNILRVCSFYEYKTVDFYLKQGFSLLIRPGIYNGHKYYRFEMNL